ncbi:MAG: cytochrome-c peroxidase [Planctomycetes bacterium]|nr:cytochrome-c peroxidase [Planctomycetota bacterium]
MRDQLAALEKLGLPAHALAAPQGIDAQAWTASIVPGNEPTAERVALGKRLYFDTLLSQDGTVACATCHDVTRGFTDQRPVSEGIGGKLGRRNAPTTLNAALLSEQFWDGRATTVEHQAGMPILNPIEMGAESEDEVVARVAALPDYRAAFQRAYGRAPSYADLRAAIGAFERTLIFLDAPFDRYLAGTGPLGEPERRGLVLFEGKARCAGCHPLNGASPLGTDNNYHNIGVAARDKDFEGLAKRALAALAEDASEHALDRLALATDMSELGRFVVTKNRADVGAFKTEQLRNVVLSAPYMHDGSLQTLWDVMDHYNKGGEDNPFLDGGIEALALTDAEIDDVVAFLFTLTDVRFAAENERALATQEARAAKQRPFKDEDLAMRRVLGFERRVLGAK